MAKDLLPPEGVKEYLGFGCVRQPGLCRTWNTFPLVLCVSKELKNYFDTNLLCEKDELISTENSLHPTIKFCCDIFEEDKEFLTGSKKGSKKVSVESRTWAIVFASKTLML